MKIRAAGKLYEPKPKPLQTNLLKNKIYTQEYKGNSLDLDSDSDEKHNNLPNCNFEHTDNQASDLEQITKGIDFQKNKIQFQSETQSETLQAESFDSRIEKKVHESYKDGLNCNLSERGVHFVLQNVSNDTLDSLSEGDSGCDIIPPPSEFASEMNPLRKSKSAPAPFKKFNKGALISDLRLASRICCFWFWRLLSFFLFRVPKMGRIDKFIYIYMFIYYKFVYLYVISTKTFHTN